MTVSSMAVKSLRLAGIVPESVTDGPGLRMTVFVQGCPHHCPGCHNPQTHDPEQGSFTDIELIIEQYRANPLLDGITLSGGEPFGQPEPLALLARAVHGLGGDIITYTGYRLEALLGESHSPAVRDLLAESDFLVDGPYIEELRTLELPFRGSSNQRFLKRGKDYLS